MGVPQELGACAYARTHPTVVRMQFDTFALKQQRWVWRVACGQVHVYEYTDLQALSTLECGAELRYAALAFSPCGRFLLAVGDAPDFSLTVWDWEAKHCLLRTVSFL